MTTDAPPRDLDRLEPRPPRDDWQADPEVAIQVRFDALAARMDGIYARLIDVLAPLDVMRFAESAYDEIRDVWGGGSAERIERIATYLEAWLERRE